MSAPSKSGQKVLRLVAVVDEKVSEDLHQTAPGGVSVGTHHNADIVVFGKAPAKHQLFDVRQGAYFLDLPAEARGKVRIGKKAVSVKKLRERYGKGGACRIKLDPRAKGKLRLGQTTLVFQFAPPKRVPPKLPFPVVFKASVFAMMGALFIYSQLAAAGIMGPFFIWANYAEIPEKDEMDIEERFLVAVGRKPADDKEDEPEEEDEVEEDELAEEDEDLVEEKDKPEPKITKKLTEKPKKFSKAAVKQARSVGVARVLGTYGGDGPGTVFDVIQSTENRLGELAAAGMTTTVEANGPLGDLAPIGGDGIDLHGQLTQTKGFDTGDGPAVDNTVKKRERKIKGRTKARGTSAAGGGDKKAIKATIKHRTSALQHCYNKALRTQPDLSGKMSFAIVINVMGSVTSVVVEEDTVGDASVKACAKAKIKGWRFPMNGAEEGADVSFSVVFSGS